jgi:hypothetical protein
LHPLDYVSFGGLLPLFDANREAHLPTYYSALALLACGALFAVIGAAEGAASPAARRRWTGLAIVAALASLDEATTLHETLGSLIERGFSPGGYLYFMWVVPGALVVLVVALAYRSFVARLQRDLRRALIVGAGLWRVARWSSKSSKPVSPPPTTCIRRSSRRSWAAFRRPAGCSACC